MSLSKRKKTKRKTRRKTRLRILNLRKARSNHLLWLLQLRSRFKLKKFKLKKKTHLCLKKSPRRKVMPKKIKLSHKNLPNMNSQQLLLKTKLSLKTRRSNQKTPRKKRRSSQSTLQARQESSRLSSRNSCL